MKKKVEDLYEKFSGLLREGNKESCVRWVRELLDDKIIDVIDLYVKILTPALNSIVCIDGNDAECIWREHVSTSIVRTIIENSFLDIIKKRNELGRNLEEKVVLVLCPPNEYHETGARMVADFFRVAGYTTIFIGSNTPKRSLLSAIQVAEPAYVAISVSNKYHVFHVQKMIQEIRARGKTDMKIIVGGNAFVEKPELYKTLMADKYLKTFEDILSLDEG